jgi:hypothetical protein
MLTYLELHEYILVHTLVQKGFPHRIYHIGNNTVKEKRSYDEKITIFPSSSFCTYNEIYDIVTRDAGIEHRTVGEFSPTELLYTGQHLKGNYFKQGCGSGPFLISIT